MTPRSLRALATVVTVLVAVHAVLALMFIIVTVSEVSLLRRIKARELFTLEEAEASDARVAAVALVLVGTLMAAGVAWLVWQYRAHANLRAFGIQGLEYTPGWSVGWWFVPVASFWKAYGAVRELWLASDPDPLDPDLRRRPTPRILYVWWLLWVVSNVSNLVSFRLADSSDIDGLILGDLFSIAGDTLAIGAAVPAIMIVRSISRRQERMPSPVVPLPPVPKIPVPGSFWVLIVLGSAALIPGLVVYVQTSGGITPILLLGLTMLLIGASIKRRASLRDVSPPPLASPPPPRESASSPTWNEGSFPPAPAQPVTVARPDSTYMVIIRAAGERPKDVERIMMEEVGYARSGARGATRNPGQRVLSTKDREQAERLQVLIQQAGGQAEIHVSGSKAPPS